MWRGILLMIAAQGFFVVTNVCSKLATDSLSISQVVFLLNAVSWLLLLPLWFKEREKAILSPQWKMLLFRSLLAALFFYVIVLALALAPVADVMLLSNSSPLFIPLIAWVWQKHRIPSGFWTSVIIGFLGISLILHPEAGKFDLGSLLALFSGFLYAIVTLVVQSIRHEPLPRVLFYVLGVVAVVAAPFAALSWQAVSLEVLFQIMIGAIAYICAQIALTRSFLYGTAHKLAPLLYTGVLFALLADAILWGRIPTFVEFVGMGLVVLAGFINGLR